MNKSAKLFAILCLAMIVLAGCGGKVKVKGHVYYADGSPFPGGVVNFTDDVNVYRGEVSTDGSFEMRTLKPGDGIAPGTYKVYMTETMLLSGGKAKTTKSGEDGKDEMNWEEVGKNASSINPKYNDPEKSGLTVTVTKNMTYDITLEE